MKRIQGLASALLFLATASAAQAQSGDFLAALIATRASDPDNATAYLADALIKDPGQDALIRQQMTILAVEGDFDAALPYAQEFLASDQEDPLALSVVRVEAIKRGDWQTALSTLPLTEGSRLDLIIEAIASAAAYTGTGEIESAEQSVEAGLDAIGFSALGNYARGLIYATEGRFEDSSNAFAAFISRDPFQYPRMALQTAYALERTGDTGDAKLIYEALLGTGARTDGEEGLARLESGEAIPDATLPTVQDIYTELLFIITRLLAEQDQAALAYRYAQEIGYLLSPESSLFPGYTEVIASSLLSLERFGEAEEFYSSLESIEEFRLAALLGQVQALSDQDRFDEALVVLDEAEELIGTTAGILRQRGILHFRAEDFERSVAAFDLWQDSISEFGPAQAQPLFIAGISAYRLEDFEKMEAALQQSLDLNPDNANVLNFLAYSWVERGINLDEGFDMLNRAVELEPQSGAIIDSLGWAYYQLGQYDEAVPFLEQAFQINPWSWEIAEHVGDVYWQVGRTREAEYFWNRALDLPDIPEDHVEDIKVKLVDGISDDEAL